MQRKTLGLPENWDEVESWIDKSRDVAAPTKIPPAETALKDPEINELKSYSVPAPTSFWENFPKNYPSTLSQNVDVNRLESLIGRCWDKWTLPQKLSAIKGCKETERKVIGQVQKGSAPYARKKRKDRAGKWAGDDRCFSHLDKKEVRSRPL